MKLAIILLTFMHLTGCGMAAYNVVEPREVVVTDQRTQFLDAFVPQDELDVTTTRINRYG